MNLPAAEAWRRSVDESIHGRTLLPDGARIVVAVSGGLDSVVLLHVLHTLAPAHRWSLVLAHFNHQLRGAASGADERFVRLLARRLGHPLRTGRWNLSAQRTAVKESGLEMAARLARHQFLAETARAARCPFIALAHHADDQVELCFLRLLRGAGGAGLGGMAWSSSGWADRDRTTLVRPLLDRTRAELADYARAQGLSHREDRSNRDLDRDRNWIRHQLLPRVAARFGPGTPEAVRRTMTVVGAEAASIRAAATTWLMARRRKPFAQLDAGVQRQVVLLQLHALGVVTDFQLVERLRSQRGQAVSAPGSKWVSCDAAGHVRQLPGAGLEDFNPRAATVSLRRAGGTRFAGVGFEWQRAAVQGPRPSRRAGRETFDADRVGPEVRLRHWQPGDRFQPIGMAQPVKLQDLLTNLKIPATRRRALVVAETAGGEIFWVEGVRIGERFKIGPATRRRLQWRWHRQSWPGESTTPDQGRTSIR